MSGKFVFNNISLACCCLELKNERQETLTTASGFLWREDNDINLITNWHVVTGVHAFSGQSLRHGQCPANLRIHITAQAFGVPDNQIVSFHYDAPLYEDFHSPFWIEHADRPTKKIDVVALRLSNMPKSPKIKMHCVNDYPSDDLIEMVGVDVFPVGYPLGLPPIPRLPIWKRGSVATEPFMDWEKRPAFLIDCRTSPGMSSSPVMRQVFGPAPLSNGTILGDRIRSIEFLGVYSGRLAEDENIASIGIVWRASTISGILARPVAGTRNC